MKDELGGKLMTEFSALRPKTHRYLTDNNEENKKAKGARKCVIKQQLNYEEYENCFEPILTENEINCLEKGKLSVNSLKEFVKNNKLTLKS